VTGGAKRDEIVSSRRPSAYFIPVAQPKKKGKQLELGTEWTDDRLRENDYINDVRAAVGDWRRRDYPGVTRTTRRLLEYWQRPDRDRRLFFCQIEAAETAIYLTECVGKAGKQYLTNKLREANQTANPELDRMAFKMATGSGKTVVMAMLIAWHALNKIEDPQDARFSDSFLIVAPAPSRARRQAHSAVPQRVGCEADGASRQAQRAKAAGRPPC
jgi:type III restriction enzyme